MESDEAECGTCRERSVLCIILVAFFNLAIFFVAISIPFFVIEIDQIYGKNTSDLIFYREDGQSFTADGTVLKIKCFRDAFQFEGLAVNEPALRTITGTQFVPWLDPSVNDRYRRPFNISVDSRTCNWEGRDPEQCRQYYRTVDGPEGCIPSGLLGIVRSQQWYDADANGSCNTSFERRATKILIAMSLIGSVGLWFFIAVFQKNVRILLIMSFVPGMIMLGLLIVLFMYGQNNMCAKAGRTTAGYVVLSRMVSLSAFSLSCISVVECITLTRERYVRRNATAQDFFLNER